MTCLNGGKLGCHAQTLLQGCNYGCYAAQLGCCGGGVRCHSSPWLRRPWRQLLRTPYALQQDHSLFSKPLPVTLMMLTGWEALMTASHVQHPVAGTRWPGQRDRAYLWQGGGGQSRSPGCVPATLSPVRRQHHLAAAATSCA